jgi:hypothetical protein
VSDVLQVHYCDSHGITVLPPIQTELTKVTKIYGHFEDKVYLFIIYVCEGKVYLLYMYVTTCVIACFKQPLWSN